MADTETQATAPAAPPPAKQPTPAEVKANALDGAVEGWVATLRDSEISRHTPAWNRLMAELATLKAAVLKVL